MALRMHILILPLFIIILLNGFATIAKSDNLIIQRTISAPRRDIENTVIDGTGKVVGLHSPEVFEGFEERKVGGNKVSVFTVAWLTLAMAAATGLGAVPFFFFELEPEWAGLCNGLAAGVMLAASFDLVQEGQSYGGGNLVVVGIMSGAVFILLCKKVFTCVFLFFVVSLMFYFSFIDYFFANCFLNFLSFFQSVIVFYDID